MKIRRVLVGVLVLFLALAGSNPPVAHAATLTVSNTNDSGSGSLRQAIADAGSGDIITFAPGLTGTITLASGELSINKDLTIIGPGAASLAISGNNASRVFRIFNGVTVSIYGVTIRNGNAADGGGISNTGTLTLNNVIVTGNAATDDGGGIFNATGGTLTLTDVAISSNTATDDGGGIYVYDGTVTMTGVTINGNTASGLGGGIYNDGTVTLVNVTISGNAAATGGGGISNKYTATLTNVTISNNSGDGFFQDGYSYTSATLKNTLIANNTAANCHLNKALTSQGYNLSSDNSCASSFTAPGDLNNTNPLLGALADNGGSTQTHALQAGSPAIDAGTNTGCPSADQRGVTRPLDGDGNSTTICDIGAFEYNPPSGTTYWTSGWVSIDPDEVLVFEHNLGGNPDDYAVDLWFNDTDGSLGANRRNYGGLEWNNGWYGARWQRLTSNTIEVYRYPDDNVADQVRVTVWIPAAVANQWDSGWVNIEQGQTLPFNHNLNISADNLTVVLWFKSTIWGIHHIAFGGLSIDDPIAQRGAYWHNLTGNAIQVTRLPDDPYIQQVRLVVQRATTPHYDSGWQNIATGSTLDLAHNLNWNPDLLIVRAECNDDDLGINQRYAGGDHNGGWRGANLQNLTANSVTVARRVNDAYCDQVRVRIWKRNMFVYLPLVLRNF
jgi:predicted outer membrane repeat protein